MLVLNSWATFSNTVKTGVIIYKPSTVDELTSEGNGVDNNEFFSTPARLRLGSHGEQVVLIRSKTSHAVVSACSRHRIIRHCQRTGRTQTVRNTVAGYDAVWFTRFTPRDTHWRLGHFREIDRWRWPRNWTHTYNVTITIINCNNNNNNNGFV